MKTVLCYGDSNTWGSDPETGERFAPEVRWPGVMARELGDGFHVIEEGLPGRTTLREDPIEGSYKDGRAYLTPCLESHRPIDLVTIMLGTNDLRVLELPFFRHPSHRQGPGSGGGAAELPDLT